MFYTRIQLNSMFHLNKSMWGRRHDDLMDHLQDFMNITEHYDVRSKRYSYDIEGEIPESIPPLPSKMISKTDKEKRYAEFTLSNLDVEFKPNSKSKMARDAIKQFGAQEFNHQSVEAVTRRYVGPAMDQYGEKTPQRYWVWYKSYTEPSKEVLDDWNNIMKDNKFTVQSVYDALLDDISEDPESVSNLEKINIKVAAFRKARREFKSKYDDILVCVPKWKIKTEE